MHVEMYVGRYGQLAAAAWLVMVALSGAAGSVQAAGQAGSAEGAAPNSIWDGAFTTAQATRGQEQYKAACAMCHAEDLLGDGSPALVGEAFMNRWSGVTADDMFQTIRRTMPQTAPDSLSAAAYADIISYLLQSNNVPPGASELPSDPSELKKILVTPRPSGR
jgi:mono/diheme cytochrome c family protein